ncbi:MAG: peptide transporter substrate-binding protein [Oscillospiraceae bacterium]|nr:peptide transporter substrate-binding protein [Oscillospiraceae bacterium]
MKLKKSLALLLACVMAMALAACSSDSSGSNAVSGDSATGGEESKTLRIGMDTEPTSMNPVLSTSGGGAVVNNAIYGCLWDITCDGAYNYNLAESYEYTTEDNTEMVIHLRDTSWDDGTPVTADDVLFSFQYYINGANAYHVMNIDFDKSYAKDDQTVVLELTQASSTFTEDLALLQIISKDLYDEGGDDAVGLTPKCSGAYTLAQWSTGETIVLEKNTNWWNADQLTYDRIEISCVTEETTRMLEFESGEYDIVYLTGKDNIEKLNNGEVSGAHVQYGDIQCITYVSLNTIDFDTFQDINVRKAIAYGVDWQTIVESICGDGYAMATSPLFPAANWAYKDEGVYEYNLDQAKQYLADAGYGEGEFSFTMRIADEDFNAEIAEAMQACLAEVGINMEVSVGDSATVKEENRSNTIQCGISKNMGANDPAGVINARMSSAKPNLTKFGDETIQNLLDEACTSTADQATRTELFYELQDKAWDYCSTFPLYESKVTFGAVDSLADFSNAIDASSGYLHLNDLVE